MAMRQHRVNLAEIRVLPIENHDAVEWPISPVMSDKLQKLPFGGFSLAERTIDNEMKYAGSRIEAAFNITIHVGRYDRTTGCHRFPHDSSPPNTVESVLKRSPKKPTLK
jgi:hypothetical protein